MKTINRRLLVTAGLFVALFGLTSFNPFTQASHLAQLEEGSISLAQSSPTAHDRNGNRNSGVTTNQSDALKAALAAGKMKAPPSKSDKSENKLIADPDAKPHQSSKAEPEGKACPDGKCGAGDSQRNSALLAIAQVLPALDPEQQNAVLSKYSIEEQDFIRAKSKKSELAKSDDDDLEEAICSEGEYTERIKCFEKEKKYLKTKRTSRRNAKRIKKSEERELLNDAISDLIEEITLDSDLSPREMNKLVRKLAKLSSGDRELQEQVRVAQSYQQITRTSEAFSQQLQRSADQIGNMDNQIRQLESNPYTMQQANMLKIQRYQILEGVKSQLSQFQQQYKSVLPASRSGESSLVSSLRDQMSADYQSIISPVAGAITDQRLLTLENLPIAVANSSTVNTMPGQNGSVFGPQTSNVGVPNQTIGQQQGVVYNNMNPNMTSGMDVSRMTPAQQVQMRVGSLNTSANLMNNTVGSNIPGQTMIPQQGVSHF